MAFNVSLMVTGSRQIEQNLTQKIRQIDTKTVPIFLRTAGQIIQDEAKKIAPTRTGRLKKNIKLAEMKEGERQVVRVGFLENKPFYASFIIKGTAAHGVNRAANGGPDHPGLAPNNFLSKSLTRKKEQAFSEGLRAAQGKFPR